jgi:hypothetical protein
LPRARAICEHPRMSEPQSPDSGGGGPSFVAVLLGVFAAISFVGLVATLVAGWLLDRSFDKMVELITADTGWFGASAYEAPAEGWEPADDEEYIVEEE